ncbi:hypothetical protein V6N13_041266 [Hibiscus sabdariffa]
MISFAAPGMVFVHSDLHFLGCGCESWWSTMPAMAVHSEPARVRKEGKYGICSTSADLSHVKGLLLMARLGFGYKGMALKHNWRSFVGTKSSERSSKLKIIGTK